MTREDKMNQFEELAKNNVEAIEKIIEEISNKEEKQEVEGNGEKKIN